LPVYTSTKPKTAILVRESAICITSKMIKPATFAIIYYYHYFKINNMKRIILPLIMLLLSVQTFAQNAIEEEVKTLSKQKWQWMADKNVDSLNLLFDDKSMFVHMGGSWGKTQELNVIKGGGIHYKKAEVYSVIINIIGNTAILLNDIDLIAVVGGNEVTNPFMVTEVYVNENGKWKMGSLTFSKLSRPVKIK
jgi:hypothetical protein